MYKFLTNVMSVSTTGRREFLSPADSGSEPRCRVGDRRIFSISRSQDISVISHQDIIATHHTVLSSFLQHTMYELTRISLCMSVCSGTRPVCNAELCSAIKCGRALCVLWVPVQGGRGGYRREDRIDDGAAARLSPSFFYPACCWVRQLSLATRLLLLIARSWLWSFAIVREGAWEWGKGELSSWVSNRPLSLSTASAPHKQRYLEPELSRTSWAAQWDTTWAQLPAFQSKRVTNIYLLYFGYLWSITFHNGVSKRSKNVKRKWWPASRMAWGAEEDKRSPHSGCGGTACSVWDLCLSAPTPTVIPGGVLRPHERLSGAVALSHVGDQSSDPRWFVQHLWSRSKEFKVVSSVQSLLLHQQLLTEGPEKDL